MQIFQVIATGEVHEITDTTRPIKDLLDTNESFILCDDDARIVYLWKGALSKVRSKFIGARKLQDVRSQVGLNYRSISMDEEEVEAGEFPEFAEAIQNVRKDGFAREIKVEGDDVPYGYQNGEAAAAPKPKVYSQGINAKFNSEIEQSGPLYTGDGREVQSSYATSAGTVPTSKNYSRIELDKIIDMLDEQGLPDGFEREMVVIGNHSYSVTQKVQSFLGNKTIEHQLEPLSSLPEGIFIADGYIPRILIQDQIVVAIEFLKRKE